MEFEAIIEDLQISTSGRIEGLMIDVALASGIHYPGVIHVADGGKGEFSDNSKLWIPVANGNDAFASLPGYGDKAFKRLVVSCPELTWKEQDPPTDITLALQPLVWFKFAIAAELALPGWPPRQRGSAVGSKAPEPA